MASITVHQPEYLPWTGFFDRILKSDLFVILDDVGYQKNGFINRNKIKTADGWQWLTVPVIGRSPHLKINEVLIDNSSDWGKNQWKALYCNYSKAPYFKQYAEFFEKSLSKKWELISELNIHLISGILKITGVEKKIKKTSEMKIEGVRTERLVNIARAVGADAYLSGPGGKGYMELEKFEKAGIRVVFQEFKNPGYNQQFMKNGFLPGLSIVDLLFNCGPKSVDIILGKN